RRARARRRRRSLDRALRPAPRSRQRRRAPARGAHLAGAGRARARCAASGSRAADDGDRGRPMRGVTLLQAQRWSCLLAAVCAYLACAVSGELGPVLLVAFPVAAVLAQLYGERMYGKGDWLWTAFL